MEKKDERCPRCGYTMKNGACMSPDCTYILPAPTRTEEGDEDG